MSHRGRGQGLGLGLGLGVRGRARFGGVRGSPIRESSTHESGILLPDSGVEDPGCLLGSRGSWLPTWESEGWGPGMGGRDAGMG